MLYLISLNTYIVAIMLEELLALRYLLVASYLCGVNRIFSMGLSIQVKIYDIKSCFIT